MSRFRLSTWWQVAALLAVAAGGCHHEVLEDLPPADARKITIADRFYDVVALDAKRTLVCGYAGKILMTEDAGYTWQIVPSGTDKALYSIRFPDATNGWIVGQDGLILHSADSGKTWTRQPSGATVYLFAVDFINDHEGWVVGDKATYLHTTDGGKKWILSKIAGEKGLTSDEQILSEEPVLYDVQFIDNKTGWIVGEFGNIYHTTDGGQTWKTQQESLIGQGITSSLDIPTFFGASFIDAQNGIVAGLETRVARTRDGGATWHFEQMDLKEAAGDPLYQPFQFPDSTAWAVGAAGMVVRQRSTGEPWIRASLGMEVNTWLRGVYFLDKNDGWVVGGFGLILHTTDGGQTWLPALG
jgi:photosystem II stability/assembly factor-like uncharacterized protein